MTEPRELAEKAELYPSYGAPDRERVNGFGVMALPFASGHNPWVEAIPTIQPQDAPNESA